MRSFLLGQARCARHRRRRRPRRQPRLTDGDTVSMATRTDTQSPALCVGLTGRGLVQANGSSNEGRESLLIDFIVLVEVDCAPGVAFEA